MALSGFGVNRLISGTMIRPASMQKAPQLIGDCRIAGKCARNTMLQIISKALQTDFAQYVKEGKKVIVKITGSADASPIKRAIPYGGEYGNFTDVPVWQNGEQTTISVSKASGISTNEQLAFLRAMGMKTAILKNITALDKMDSQYDTYIEQGEGVGGQFRRIHVDFTFIDAY